MIKATAAAQVARLTVTGWGADREREALAAWLRGNPVLGRGWLVSTAEPAPVAGHMGGGKVEMLEVEPDEPLIPAVEEEPAVALTALEEDEEEVIFRPASADSALFSEEEDLDIPDFLKS